MSKVNLASLSNTIQINENVKNSVRLMGSKQASTSSDMTADILVDDIEYDPKYNGDRKIDNGEVLILADSILKEGGLYDPIVVYEDHKSPSGKPVYRILSGNKRYNAWNRLNNDFTDKGWKKKTKIPCIIHKKPESEDELAYLQLTANLGRKSDDDMEREVAIAKELWEKKSQDEREKMIPELRQLFIEGFMSADKYNELKEKGQLNNYFRNHFRPTVVFVWKLTGASGSYAGIKRTLAKINKESVIKDKDVVPDIKEEEKKSKTKNEGNLSIRTVKKKLKDVNNTLEKYYIDPSSPFSDEAYALIESIKLFLNKIEK